MCWGKTLLHDAVAGHSCAGNIATQFSTPTLRFSLRAISPRAFPPQSYWALYYWPTPTSSSEQLITTHCIGQDVIVGGAGATPAQETSWLCEFASVRSGIVVCNGSSFGLLQPKILEPPARRGTLPRQGSRVADALLTAPQRLDKRFKTMAMFVCASFPRL